MGELTPAPLEGVVVEPKGKTVGQLVEELLKLDQNMFVFTTDCCYGLDADVWVSTQPLEKYDHWLLDIPRDAPDPTVVVID